jgi:hypothetical protein
MDRLRPEQWRLDYWFLVQLAWFLFPWISTSQMYARAQNYSRCSSTHEWSMVRPSNLSPPTTCVSPLPYILCHLPSFSTNLQTTERAM